MNKDAYGKPKRRLRRGRLILGFLLGASLGTAASAADKKPEEFRKAIQAQDKGNWKESVLLLTSAMNKQPEDGQRVRIYGTRYLSYLPHYYLGFALYQQKKCTEALKHWDQSLGIGAVQTSEEFQALLIYSEECKRKAMTP